MRRRLVALAACAAAGAAAAPAAADDAPFIDWNPLLPSVAQPYHPSRELDCVDGRPTCVEDTLTEMYRRFDRLYATCDHNAVFGITYIRVTEAIRKAVFAGVYEEPAFLWHEDRVFARMYFESYDAWERGDREHVPPAWREAFDAGRERSVSGVGNLLMSMNAHINRDMPFMLDALGLTKPDGSTRKIDHDRGNKVLNALYDDVLTELAQRFDPGVDDANAPGTTGDDATVFQILQGWREDVWRNAERLGAARTLGERKAVADYIEQYSLGVARQLRASTTISDSSARDAWCAAYRRSHREVGGLAHAVAGKRGLRARRAGRARGRAARGHVVRGRVVRVRVVCPGSVRDCAGTLALTRRGRRLSRLGTVALRAGQSQVIRVRLNRAGRRALARARRHRRRLAVRALTAAPSPWGTVRTASLRTRVRVRR